MKKTLKYLLLFICLFLVGVRVDAATSYQEDWYDYYNYSDDYNIYWDVFSVSDGSIALGERSYYQTIDSVNEELYGGMIVKHNSNGEVVWKIEKENYYYLKGTKVDDGFLVLAQYYEETDTEDIAYITLLKYDFDGKEVWETKLEEGEIDYDFISLISLERYNDIIGISYNESFYIYNLEGKLIKDLSNENFIFPVIDINSDGIYVAGLNSDINTVIGKYSHDKYEKVGSKVIYEGTVVDNNIEDLSLALELSCVNGNIVVSTYNSSEVSELSIYDKNLNLVKSVQADTIVNEIENKNKDFITIGKYHENDAKGLNKELLDYINDLDEFKFEVSDSKARLAFAYNINIYDLNLESKWNYSIVDYAMYGVDYTTNGFIIAGEEYYDGAMLLNFVKPPLDIEWSKEGNLDYVEYFYDVAYHENGYIAVGWSTQSLPRSMTDAESTLRYYGKIVSYDQDGNVLWHTNLGVASEIFKVAIVEDGFFVLVNNHDTQHVELVKYDYDGRFVKEVDLGIDLFEEYEFDEIKLSGYGKYAALVYNGIFALIDNNMESCADFYDSFNLNNNFVFDVNMNETGTYLVYGDNTTYDIVVQKYDTNMKLAKERIILEDASEGPYDINQYGDKIYLLFDEKIYILNDDLSLNGSLELDYNRYYDIIGTKKGFVLTGSRGCEQGSAPGNGCDLEGFLMKYDLSSDKISYLALDYLPYGSDNANGDVVAAGYGYISGGSLETKARVGKYVYPVYNVDTSTDGNGSVTSNKVSGMSGEEVEFTIEPKEGYTLKKVTVITSSGEVLKFTDYKFTMPSEDVEIYAEFELIPTNPNTGLFSPLIILSIVVICSLFGYKFLKKKKYI